MMACPSVAFHQMTSHPPNRPSLPFRVLSWHQCPGFDDVQACPKNVACAGGSCCPAAKSCGPGRNSVCCGGDAVCKTYADTKGIACCPAAQTCGGVSHNSSLAVLSSLVPCCSELTNAAHVPDDRQHVVTGAGIIRHMRWSSCLCYYYQRALSLRLHAPLAAVLLPRWQAEVHEQRVLPCSKGVRADLLQAGLHVRRRRVQAAPEVRHRGELRAHMRFCNCHRRCCESLGRLSCLNKCMCDLDLRLSTLLPPVLPRVVRDRQQCSMHRLCHLVRIQCQTLRLPDHHLV